MGTVAHEILGFIFLPLNGLIRELNFSSQFPAGRREAIQQVWLKKINDRKGGKEGWLIRKSTSRPFRRGRWTR
jgi:hypothetical protein